MIMDAVSKMMPNRLRLWVIDQLTIAIDSTSPHPHVWVSDACWGGKHDGKYQGTLGFDRWCRRCRRREHLGV